jgi:vitamin B12 transporter
MKPAFILLLLFSIFITAGAQTDTTITLHEIQIASSKINFISGLYKTQTDSSLKTIYAQHSLSDLLNDNSAIFLKNYGSGGLSTISLRGGNAYQTALLWNGFNIASPLNGQADLSLQNIFFFDDITIQYGGASAIWGSGAVSGCIHLDNKPSFNSGINISGGFTAGSFSNYTGFGGMTYGDKKYCGSVKFIYHDSKNNFKYFDENSKTTNEQTHASINLSGLISDNYFLTGKNSILGIHLWYTNSNREIPPTLLQSNSEAKEKDIHSRFIADWKYSLGKNEIAIRSACFLEHVNYDDELLTSPSDNKCKSFINEITFLRKLNLKHHLLIGLNHEYASADSSSNLNHIHTSRIALFSLYKYHSANEKAEITISGRQEFSTINAAPFTFSAGTNYQINRSILIRLAGSRVFRNPTLNDLYWNPGGNINLHPESGYSFETGLQFDVLSLLVKHANSPSSLILNTTLYYKKINDWIIWYPATSSVWSPQNLTMVKSRGTEIILDYSFRKPYWSAGIHAEFYYTLSTNEKTQLANDASLHCQLMYVPLVRANTRIFLNFHSLGLYYNHSYTGIRYTTSDNSASLPPYNLDNIEIDKIFHAKKTQFRIFIRINNIFDISYQSVLNNPMPCRTYETGLTFNFTNNKN